jgi:L-erythro-3,5-diaminohexanoate dehydrogenase
MQNLGERYGVHRVKDPVNLLPQQAQKLDNSPVIRPSEMRIRVESLNIDSASFRQIRESCGDDEAKIQNMILDIVSSRGKMQNPVTGSGGMLIGTVDEIGSDFLTGRTSDEIVQKGDRIATLVSLTLTPLKIDCIKKVHLQTDRVDIDGHAILFQSGVYSPLPSDINPSLALAVLDVCGAPAQTSALCTEGQNIVVIGGAGKSGVLCLYEAKKAVGPAGRVFAIDYGKSAGELLNGLSFVDDYSLVDARDALAVMNATAKLTKDRMADVVINVANIPGTEMGTILSARQGGTAYFFSMATDFAKATLGAEGVGAHVELIMGNGYRPGHAKLALDVLRQSTEVRNLYNIKYGKN